ncbi:DUF1648 domain-containing protein [Demequina sp. TTPB684]|uniref:DUF1648 domain-containing protein n=1 Tax=unclassified Demequina TaxID=2620311 RepID=UPI001CF4989E|nr:MULTISPECIES: DUF1648 domain-containing protein [unclassified Demequina]MCB2413386.1 DUF1648 domain-containing protein [Demequina sp. TTPB684]UPU87399.1 DUF1648 domain-containing protein [Demequina sp. TMPB413]
MTSPTSPSVVSRFVVVALAVPTAITVAGLALQAAWLDSLPHPAAVHWGPSDTPDGFGSGWTFLAITAGLGLGLPLLIALTTLPMLRRGARGATFRFMAAFALGMSAFMVTLNTASVAVQRGLAAATDAPGILPWMLVALGVGAVAGLAGWFVQPEQHTEIPDWDAAAQLDLGPNERVVWMRTTTIARWGVLLLAGVGVAVALSAIAAWVAGELATAWILLGALALLTFAASIATVFHVSIDDDGLTAVAAPGFPRVRVPLADVADVGVAPVNAFAEFGGYGLRTRPGVTGIVLRNGDALRVNRTQGRSVVITVDDARTAAAVLTALAARASARGKA